MQQAEKQKQGIVTRIEAVAIQCPDCGSFCVNESGSTMIEDSDTIVTCTFCRKNYTVPPSAFKVKAAEAARITTCEEALEIAKERQVQKYRKTGRKSAFGIVSFTSTGGTRFRIYPYTQASRYGLRDCKVGEAVRLEACLDQFSSVEIFHYTPIQM